MIMSTTTMKEKGMRIVVPKWSGGYDGYFTVSKGSMTDDEWKQWLAVSKGEISRQITLFMSKKRPAAELQGFIVKFLKERGVDAWPA